MQIKTRMDFTITTRPTFHRRVGILLATPPEILLPLCPHQKGILACVLVLIGTGVQPKMLSAITVNNLEISQEHRDIHTNNTIGTRICL